MLARATVEVNFILYLVLINFNFNSCMWLVVIALESIGWLLGYKVAPPLAEKSSQRL